MINIHLYGKLRRFAPNSKATDDSILQLQAIENESLGDLLKRAGLDIDEIYTIFLNAKLLATQSKMGPYLGYQQVCEDCLRLDMSIVIKDGDRLGLFGLDMAALVV